MVYEHNKQDLTELAKMPYPLSTSRWFEFELAFTDSRMQLRLMDDDQPIVDVETQPSDVEMNFGVAVNRGGDVF